MVLAVCVGVGYFFCMRVHKLQRVVFLDLPQSQHCYHFGKKKCNTRRVLLNAHIQ